MVAQINSPALNVLEVADDPRLSRETKEFLNVLNSGGVSLETLSPLEARQVLVDGQASVTVDLSGIEESEKTITADGYTITLNIVRPEGVQGILPVFIFIHERKDIYASPLRATVEQLKGLPPALVVVAESDVLHDEGTAYGRKLNEAGVDVTLVQYDGMIHDFGLLNGLAELSATRSLFVQAAAELKKHLS